MKKLIFLLALPTLAIAQSGGVYKSTASATKDQIIEDLKFGTGRTGSFLSGSTLSIAGVLSGTPTGGALDLSALTLTLPATVSGGTSSLQPLDSDLTAIAALATTANGRSLLTASALTTAGLGLTNGAAIDALGAVASNGLLARTAASTYSARTLTGTASQITVTNGDGVAGNPTLSLPSTLTISAASGNPTISVGMTAAGAANQFPLFQLTDARAGGSNWNIENGRTPGTFAIRDTTNSNQVFEIVSGGLSAGNAKVGFTTPSTSTTTGALQVAGGVGIGGNLFANSITTASNININAAAANANLRLTSVGGSGRDWYMRSNTTGVLDIYDNSGLGTRLSIGATGDTTVAGALSATGAVSSSATGSGFTSTGPTTQPRAVQLGNTSGSAYFAIEGSVGGANFTGSLAYATLLYSPTQPIQLITNSVKVVDAKSTGVAVLGSTTNDSAAAGYVGEYVSSTVVSGSAVSLTTATAKTVTSISLTAGDWDVSGVVDFALSGASCTGVIAGSSSITNTLGGQDSYTQQILATTTLTDNQRQIVPLTRYSLSGTTTVYLVGQAAFSAGTTAAYGTLRARRVR